jgi:hypothetical protein
VVEDGRFESRRLGNTRYVIRYTRYCGDVIPQPSARSGLQNLSTPTRLVSPLNRTVRPNDSHIVLTDHSIKIHNSIPILTCTASVCVHVSSPACPNSSKPH